MRVRKPLCATHEECKQSSMAWNSLDDCFLGDFRHISKILSAVFEMLLTNGIQKIETSFVQGIKHNIAKMFQIIFCVIVDLPCKIYWKSIHIVSLMLPTGSQPSLGWEVWSSLVRNRRV